MKNVRLVTGFLTMAFALSLGLVACKDTRPSPASSPAAPVPVFLVRGEVTQVPVEGKPGSQFMVHHEAIPGFVDETGAVVGMGSMTMFFPTRKGLSLASLRPGDKIRFTLSVDWPNNQVEITQIDPLPADTKLDFSAKPAPADSAAR